MALLISTVDTIPKVKALLSPRTRTHSVNYNIYENYNYHRQDPNECKHLYWLEDHNAKCEYEHEEVKQHDESDIASPYTPSTPTNEQPFILLATSSIHSKYTSTTQRTVDSIKKQVEQLNLLYSKFKLSVDATERCPLLTRHTPSLTLSTDAQRDRILNLNLAYSQFANRAREESQVPLKSSPS